MVVITDFKNMFWGVTIGGGKRYSQMVESSFHISMAALDPSSAKGCVSVMIQHEKAEFLLCSLNSETLLQQALDLNFTEGEEVTFFLNGTGVVHLTGFLLDDDDDDGDDSEQFGPVSDSDEDDMETSDEDAPQLVPAKSKDVKRKLEGKFGELSSAKKKKQSLFAEASDSEDDSEDEDFQPQLIDDEVEVDSDMEESDDIPEDEFSEEEEEKPVVSSKKAKKLIKEEKKSLQQDKTPKQKANKDSSSKTTPTAANQSLTKTPSSPKPPASEGETTEGKKKKKKKKKKNKGDGDNAAENGGVARTPSTPQSETKATPSKRVVGGGVIVEDLQVGHGPVAKPGKMKMAPQGITLSAVSVNSLVYLSPRVGRVGRFT